MTQESFTILTILFKIKQRRILAYSAKKQHTNAAVNEKIIASANTSRTDKIVGKNNILNLASASFRRLGLRSRRMILKLHLVKKFILINHVNYLCA